MSDDDLPAGAVLDGKWRIESVLGKGGMGAVYAAAHVRNGSAVALKVLHRELGRDQALRDRFLHEGYAANQVGHAGTVRVLDDGVTPDGHTYLVMERLLGSPLDAVADAAGGKLPLPDVLKHTLGVLEIIGTAHDKGIVHRDIKPENVFICRDGTLKILDFGIAHVKEAQTKARLTVTGVPMGTPAFMPPEQALAHWERVDARSDVYSIAATMMTLLSGRLVHEARSLPELLVMVSTRPAPPARQIVPELPPTIASVIDRALAFEPRDRWANARAMQEALRAAANALGRETLPSGAHPTPSIIGVSAQARRVLDEPSVQTFRAVAASSEPKLLGLQTAAPVSSSSKNTERPGRKKSLWLLLPGLAIGGVLAGVAAYVVIGPTTSEPPALSGAPVASERTTAEPTPPPVAKEEPLVVAGAQPSATVTTVPSSSATVAPTAKPTSTAKTGPRPRATAKPDAPATAKPATNPLDFN